MQQVLKASSTFYLRARSQDHGEDRDYTYGSCSSCTAAYGELRQGLGQATASEVPGTNGK